jgi:LysM repeat protein
MRPLRLLPVTALLLAFTACDDGRWAPGYLITDGGEAVGNTDANKRALTIRTITTQLDQQLGGHWRSEVDLPESPRYQRGADDDGNSGWRWDKATVTVTLIGDGTAPATLSDDEVTKAVRDYLYRQVERPHRNLSVTTIRVVDAARFAAKAPATPAATVSKPAAAPAAGQRYRVQAGDTWADLSQAFYGSPQHWRVISDANQGGELSAGREIVIPPKP